MKYAKLTSDVITYGCQNILLIDDRLFYLHIGITFDYSEAAIFCAMFALSE